MSTPTSCGAKAHALSLWRDGYDQLIVRRLHQRHQSLYERAIADTLSLLQDYATLDALVAAYFLDETDDACQRICDILTTATTVVLNAGLVEDASYWLRMQQLQAAAQQ